MNEDNSTKSNSSNVLLIMAKDEYSKESEISNTLDNKSSFFITAIIAITTLFVPIIPFKHLIAFFRILL